MITIKSNAFGTGLSLLVNKSVFCSISFGKITVWKLNLILRSNDFNSIRFCYYQQNECQLQHFFAVQHVVDDCKSKLPSIQSKPCKMFAATLQPSWPSRPQTKGTLLFYFLKLYNFVFMKFLWDQPVLRYSTHGSQKSRRNQKNRKK